MSNIVFIGAGKMASAIAGGLLKKGISAKTLKAFDISAQSAKLFHSVTGIEVHTDSPDTILSRANIVIIAVKPQQITDALHGKTSLLKSKLIISIAAGVKVATLKTVTGSNRIIRVMPNTPALVGQGVSAYAAAEKVSGKDIIEAERILGAVGIFCRVDESLMDAVTGLSGSGPAYVFDFIQALADGGVHAGIPRDTALKLAAQTVAGAALMVLETGTHPGVLRDQVASPGGTTIRGLAVLEENSFRGIVAKAVIAAAAKSTELGTKK
ncbi:MAG: pyrroline-5-carboxylate reductase [Victivallaceae bacterium]